MSGWNADCDVEIFTSRSCGADDIVVERCADGIRRAQDCAAGPDYMPGAWIPGERWVSCALTPRDAGTAPFPSHRACSLLRFDSSVIDRLRALPVADPLDPDSQAVAQAIAAVAESDALRVTRLVALRRSQTRSASPTITRSRQDARLIGLHLDSNSRAPLPLRRDVGNRLCVNLGTATRHLLFCGSSLERMLQLSPPPQTLANDPPRFVRAFLDRHPSVPLFRLAIPPAYAYVAPTECLVHDGCASGIVDDDIVMFAGVVEIA